MADISMIYDGDNDIGYNIKDAIGRANCASGLQNLEDCIISILPESVIDDTLPISFLANGDPLSSVVLSGNGQQTGTPTPDSPVMPEFVGVRTGNLLPLSDKTFTITVFGSNLTVTCIGGNLYFSGTVGEIASTYTMWKTNFTFELEAGTYYCNNPSPLGSGFSRYVKRYSDDTNILSPNDYTFTLSETTKCYLSFYIYDKNLDNQMEIMLNTGSTALPYEPFGYKIPISCAGQTVPIYLGQTQTVRKIKKLVFDGTEGWTITSNGVLRIGFSGQLRPLTPLCTHYLGSNASAWSNIPDKSVTVSINGYLAILDTTYTTSADFKVFLSTQYAAGTPVTVWYVLAEPTTGIVNEPLCKIGDYADELHSTDAAVTIPTARGQNTLTVETDLQPSRIKVIGNIVGTGETESHPVTDKVDTPTDIPSNSDLDAYTTDGVYRITDTSIAATILHAPITNVKYILEVFSLSDTDKIQRITTETDVYTRQKSSGVWGSWYKFTGTVVT